MAIAGGTSGTCTWTISDEGVLTVRPTSGTSGYFVREWLLGKLAWSDYYDQIKSVSFEDDIRIYTEQFLSNPIETGDASLLFDPAIQSAGAVSHIEAIDGLNSLKGVTSTASMFGRCDKLTSLDFSGFDTSAVTSMGSMFLGCSSIEALDLSNFDTRNVTEANDLFRDCSFLSEVIFGSNFDLSQTLHDNDYKTGFGKGTNTTNGIIVQDDEAFARLTAAQRAGTWERGVAPMYEVEAYRMSQGSPDEGGDDVRINVTWATDASTSTRTLTIYQKQNSDPTYPSTAIVTRTLTGNSGREEITIQNVGSAAYDFKVQFEDGTNTFIAFPSIQSNIELVTIDPEGNVWTAGTVTENNGTRDIDLNISEATIQKYVNLGMSLT